MDKANHPNSEVILLAYKVRKAAKELARKSFGHSDSLEGYCAVASHALSRVLKSYGYIPKIIYAELYDDGPHSWVELNGWIIDITATQFGISGEYPEVFTTREIDSTLHRGSFHKEFEDNDYGYGSLEEWEKYLWNPETLWEEYFQDWENELFEKLKGMKENV